MNAQIKFLMSLMLVSVLFLSVYAGKNNDNIRILKNAEKELVDSPGKKMELNLDSKDYIFIYYSAHWCPSCRAFTPELVKFYNEYKTKASIELIFVSADESDKEMKEYMSSMSMPWPAVAYNEIEKCGISKFAGEGIPCLVLLDKNRNVIASCLERENYASPEEVLDKFKEIIDKAGDEKSKK